MKKEALKIQVKTLYAKYKHLSGIETFGLDRYRIGQLLGQGDEHDVYAYGDNYVIKVQRKPHRGKFIGQHADEKERDLALVTPHFGKYILPTTLIRHPYENHRYILLQRKLINFSDITPDNIQKAKNEIDEILGINRSMVENHGISLSILGHEGFVSNVQALFPWNNTQPQMTNIVIEEHPQLGTHAFIPDVTVRHLKHISPQEISLRDRLEYIKDIPLYETNRVLIKHHFGVNIGQRR